MMSEWTIEWKHDRVKVDCGPSGCLVEDITNGRQRWVPADDVEYRNLMLGSYAAAMAILRREP